MSSFSRLLESNTEYRTVLDSVKKGRVPLGILGVSQVPKAHFIHSLCVNTGRKALIITPDEASANRFSSDLNTMGTKCLLYPAKDFNFRPADRQSREYERERIGVLGCIADGTYGAVVCSAEAAMQLTVPESVLAAKSVTVEAGSDIEQKKLSEALMTAGYVRTDMVEGKGQFSVRGSIVDFFPPDRDDPIRLEFWGDTVDIMASFDIESQRKKDGDIDSVKITPATEIVFDSDEQLSEKIKSFASSLRGKTNAKVKESLFEDSDKLDNGVRLGCTDRYLPLAYEDPETIFDYCRDDLLFISETAGVKERAKNASELINEDIKMMFEDGVLCKGLDRYTIDFTDIVSYYEKSDTVYLDNFTRGSFDTPVKELVNINVSQSSSWSGSFQLLLDDIEGDIRKKYTVIIFTGTPKAAVSLEEDMLNEGFECVRYEALPDEFAEGRVNIVCGSLSSCMTYPAEKIRIVSQNGYHGGSTASAKKKKQKKNKNAIHSIDELVPGCFVVHSNYGIGIFEGIVSMTVSGVLKDFIKIRYMGSESLYIPVTQLDMVSKYIGPGSDDGKGVKISRLGTKEWEKTKARVRGAVKDMAKELLELYAKRQNTKGYEFSPDIDMQNDFERRFEFDETEDQLRCIDEIKQDMEKPYPMDRLLCGDVGFGKTEVALRAAFKCIADGKQCAILVPTTILALQHYRTLLRRFEGFPVNIDMLSRFRNRKQITETVKNLKHGQVDILVGTHRLISKDVVFRDLGLVIIDEEQRFGVAQKEKLKKEFPGVDVLTLSATPIPRTLNMAMTGIRDMSVIEEAPQDRYPVQSYVLEHDMNILSEAIQKELRRGGQVYYLYNRVEDIEEKAAEIRHYVPDARIGIGHGKMEEKELSEVWRQLLEGEIDILVCTTIIETGVDVPNCNTLIIENADRMGLSQLHQIRGRVGRSSRRGFAYFTFRKDKQLSEIATKRLEAIREYTEFGSGFKIAMKDLEIRGAGSILGAQQHGHLEAVGYDMYLKLLSEAVENEQNGTEIDEKTVHECVVDISINAHIPENYITATPQRLSAYRRIADIRSQDDAEDVIDEFIDRYGDVPDSVRGLIQVALLRNQAMNNGIYEIKQIGNMLIMFTDSMEPEKLKKLIASAPGRVSVAASPKSAVKVGMMQGKTALENLVEIFKILA